MDPQVTEPVTMSRPTFNQQRAIADFLMKNPGIAKGTLRSDHAKYKNKIKWEKISTTINEIGGAQKNGKGWAKFWSDKKCALKKRLAMFEQSSTGCTGVDDELDLTSIDKQFMEAMGIRCESARSFFTIKNENQDSSSTEDTDFESSSSSKPAAKTDRVTSLDIPMSTSRASYQQLEVLADFLTDNSEIAKGIARTAKGKHNTKKKWDKVSTTLNKLGGVKKNGKGWAKLWSDRKCALKKRLAMRQSSLECLSEETVDVNIDLTPIDKRFLEAMGGQLFTSEDNEGSISFEDKDTLELTHKMDTEDTDSESPTFSMQVPKFDKASTVLIPSSSCRPTQQQLNALATFLVENPDIAKCARRTSQGKYESKIKWNNISTTINALGGAQKDGKGWAKFWSDKKFTLKRKFALLAQSSITGDEAFDEVPDISPIEKRFLESMGGLLFVTANDDEDIETHDPLDDIEDSRSECPSPIQDEETNRDVRRSQRRSPKVRERSPLKTSFSAENKTQHTRTGNSMLQKDREKKTEDETVTGVLSQAVAQIGNLTAAIEDMSQATRDGAQTIALALNKIAASIMLLKSRES